MIILCIALLSILAMGAYHATAQLHFKLSSQHLINFIITLVLIVNVYRLSQLWHFPLWGKYLIGFGMMIAILFGLLFIRALFEAIMLGSSHYFVAYFARLQHYWTHLIPIARHDFWELVETCIYDPNDPHTWHLFEKG